MLPKTGNLLIVDDNRDDLRLLAAILIERGHEVRPVLDSSAALIAARIAPPDLIVLDVQMPHMNGYETCRQLKADPQTCDIPVIFISARHEVFDKVTAFACGGVDYISKPYQAEEVLARIEIQLRLYHMQQHLEQQNRLLQQEISERTRIAAELHRYQDHLEELVDARTTALQSANAQLQAEIAERKQVEAALQLTEAAARAQAEDLSKMNVELTRALRLKDEFMAMMSHELRTPLNAILGFSEALIEDCYGPISEQQHEALDIVVQSGRHLLGLLSDILDLTHIEAGAAQLSLQSVDVEEIGHTVTRFIQPAAQQKRIQIQYIQDDQVVWLRADERRLTQILINLLDNAVKFTPEGETVGLEVSVDPSREQICFTVWDTGIGIAETGYERLFQPFTQVDGRLIREYGGIGVGLSLVYRLVDLHGGSISLESTPGLGSRFSVNLPWAPEHNQVPYVEPVRTVQPAAWRSPPRVLIADDHEQTLQLYAEALRQQGCAVVTARTSAEALAQLCEQRPDLAVLDLQMPIPDGLSVIQHVREDPRVAHIPILALTNLDLPGDRARCLATGANAYMRRPVSLRILLETLAGLYS